MSVMKDCFVCGKPFKACNTCQKGVDEVLQWRRVVCCPEHFAYHIPIIQYSRGKIDKTTAQKELQSAIDTYGSIEFADNVKSIVNEILAEDKPIEPETVNDSSLEDIVSEDFSSDFNSEENNVAEEFEASVTENEVFSSVTKKRKNKKDN